MRSLIRDLMHRATGARAVRAELEAARGSIATLEATLRNFMEEARQEAAARRATDTQGQAQGLPVMPGTAYSTLAIPLEYPPSRRMMPRWGATDPLLKSIVDWVEPGAAGYWDILRAMTARAPQLQKIAMTFDPALLPEPAWCGVPFAAFDSAALYTIIGQAKPKTYLEIGSGTTTAFAWRSIRDHGLDTKIISIDPEPRAAIDGICDEVIRSGLETCDLGIFDRLEAGDILFFDGSHRVFMNSDVTVFMLDVLPRIKPGVLIHVHDIHLPWDYPDMFVNWYWSEQYILAAYISGAAARLKPILPTAWVCRSPAFESWFEKPPVDLGSDNGSWRGGGSMWFTPI